MVPPGATANESDGQRHEDSDPAGAPKPPEPAFHEPCLSLPPNEGGDDGSSELIIRRLKNAPRADDIWLYLDRRYYKRLLIYTELKLGAHLRRRCEPEDVMAMAWYRAVQDIDKFEYTGPSCFFRWLCQKVVWEILNRDREFKRRGSKEPVLSSDLSTFTGQHDPEAPSRGPLARLMDQDLRNRMVESLERVPDIYRRVLVARYLEDKPRKEIADEFGLRENTVSVQLIRGLDHWRSSLGEDPLAHL